jgi:hypothetical protein
MKTLNSSKIAVAAFALMASLLAAPAHAQLSRQQGPMVLNPNALRILAPNLRCGVYLSHHIVVQNHSPTTLPAGTKVHWSISSPAAGGDFVVPAAIAPYGGIVLENVIPFAADIDAPCKAGIA